jgi:predicted ribosomally synthesized peptide with nif11-like leader
MSKGELQRFLRDLGSLSGLAEEFQRFKGDLEGQVCWANERGYAISLEEAEGLSGAGELSDDELEAAAGGWTGDPAPGPGTGTPTS